VSPALWYLSRASGLVSLVLFTAVMVMGVLGATRFARPTWPRLATALTHRDLALTSVVFLAVHIGSAVIDSYVPLTWLDVVVPFGSDYQPLWVGVGAVAFDLLVALVVTSLLRTRLPARVWRGVHWLAYACWPVALLHGVAMAETGWFVGVEIGCLLAVAAAAAYRMTPRTVPQ